MTRRTRILLVVLGVITLAAAAWIVVGIQTGAITSSDHTVEVQLIPPAGS